MFADDFTSTSQVPSLSLSRRQSDTEPMRCSPASVDDDDDPMTAQVETVAERGSNRLINERDVLKSIRLRDVG